MRCRQCAARKPDNGWAICPACLDRNAEYEKECARLAHAIRQEFSRKPPSRIGDPLNRPLRFAEMKDRKARHAATASHTFEEYDE